MTDFGASSNSSESEIFFRMTDRLQMESCAMAVVKDGKSVVIAHIDGNLALAKP